MSKPVALLKDETAEEDVLRNLQPDLVLRDIPIGRDSEHESVHNNQRAEDHVESRPSRLALGL